MNPLIINLVLFDKDNTVDEVGIDSEVIKTKVGVKMAYSKDRNLVKLFWLSFNCLQKALDRFFLFPKLD